MNTYKIPKNIDKWDFENGFYLTCENNRISNFVSHLELYKMILNLPGDVLEFGVYKGSSFIQFLSCYPFAYTRLAPKLKIFKEKKTRKMGSNGRKKSCSNNKF